MHIHILGIGGTFMAGIAAIARAAGMQVTGQDKKLYPPMSTQLEALGIDVIEGYEDDAITTLQPDLIVVGNVMKRGMPVIETMLNRAKHYTSGPDFLYQHILKGKWVLAIAGTHGKTTTSSMLAWILEHAGKNPGFLIGGVCHHFPVTARQTNSPYFVIEADEYDTAFFDKRSKFVHYHPKTLVINNLEFDHADIFDDMAQIQKQFHHMVRMVPSEGSIIYPEKTKLIDEVIQLGCWSQQFLIGKSEADWGYRLLQDDLSAFAVVHRNKTVAEVHWQHGGLHNIYNALAAISSAYTIGITPEVACSALSQFKGIARRMQPLGTVAGIQVIEDFAHHPTAIATTLAGVKAKYPHQSLSVLLDPASYTMRTGVHGEQLLASLSMADQVFLKIPEAWPALKTSVVSNPKIKSFSSNEALCQAAVAQVKPQAILLIMSNGAFIGVRDKILTQLAKGYP